MLERNVQPAAKHRMQLEQTAHTHRRLRRPVQPRRVVEHDREPPLARRIGHGSHNTSSGTASTPYTIPSCGRARCGRPSPPPLQPLRARPVALPVLRPTRRLTIRMTQIPLLIRRGQAAHEHPVDELAPLASRAPRAPDNPGRHSRPPRRTTPSLVPVLHTARRIPNRTTPGSRGADEIGSRTDTPASKRKPRISTGFAELPACGALCARQESNLRPRAPEARALSPELRARRETEV